MHFSVSNLNDETNRETESEFETFEKIVMEKSIMGLLKSKFLKQMTMRLLRKENVEKSTLQM